ncbi:MAG: flagellar basal body L-ring protein FlgH [Planctomycetes bacterium]|nr:flagellar basal body L-ring protein FlgH [Planctomycetota bacterium]
MSRARRLLPALLLLALGGCAAPPGPPPARYGSEFPPPRRPRPPSPSLWPSDPGAERNAYLIADPIARTRGDVVTILIRENQTASHREDTRLEQKTGAKLQLESLSGFPTAFRQGLPGGEVSSGRTFDAESEYDKQGRLEARVTCMIVDVYPNGNLVVEGGREIRIDDELKVLRVSGIVRPLDILPGNTVLSENLAEARVSYEGTGPLTRNGQRGAVGKVVDYLWHNLWPF